MHKLNRVGVFSLHVFRYQIIQEIIKYENQQSALFNSTAQHRETDASRCCLYHRSPTWIIIHYMYLLSASSTAKYVM